MKISNIRNDRFLHWTWPKVQHIAWIVSTLFSGQILSLINVWLTITKTKAVQLNFQTHISMCVHSEGKIIIDSTDFYTLWTYILYFSVISENLMQIFILITAQMHIQQWILHFKNILAKTPIILFSFNSLYYIQLLH